LRIRGMMRRRGTRRRLSDENRVVVFGQYVTLVQHWVVLAGDLSYILQVRITFLDREPFYWGSIIHLHHIWPNKFCS